MTQLSLTRDLPDADGRYLAELLGTRFTDEQLAVVTAPLRPQLVVAGAGSGKTTVMAARVVHAVAFHGVPADAVLGLTFTNKAAGQLSDSVRRALRRLGDGAGDALPTVATYHSYAASVVRDHALRIGREPVTALLTEAGRWQLAMRVVRRAHGPYRYLSWQPVTVAAYLLALDGELAEHLAATDAVRAYDAALAAKVDALPKATKKARDVRDAAGARDELLELVETYRGEKRRLDLVDYGDQIALAAEIARTAPDVGRIERDRYRLVLLDEYQDTGVGQRELLSTLFCGGHPVSAVGDPHQGIYGWRGASVGNLHRFLEHFADRGGGLTTLEGVQPVAARNGPQPLMTSFRCGARILDVANALSGPLRQTAGAARIDVPPLVPRADSEAGSVVVSLHERVDHEARWIAERIAAEVDADRVTPGGVAVLCRRRTDFPLLHRELVARDVPVEVVGLGGLLEMPEVADVVAVLRVLVDPTANPSMLRLLTGPRWRIGARDLAALGRTARWLATTDRRDTAGDGSDVDAALQAAAEGVDPVDVPALSDALDVLRDDDTRVSSEARDRLLRLRAELDELRGGLGQPIVEIATEVIRRTGLDVELEVESSRVAAARTANLAAFLDHAARFTGIEGESDLASFLGWLDAAVAAESGLEVGGVSDADTVKLMTVHKAKGLEWDVVALPGLTATVFPSGRGRSRWTTNACVLPYPCRGDAVDLPPEPDLTTAGLDGFAALCKAADADEERRLGYVAVTRARRLLLVSGYWWGRTQRRPMGPSSLLLEIAGLAEAGAPVERDVWCRPPDGADNPLAMELATDVAWPAPFDPVALQRRRTAADLVSGAAASVEPRLAGGEARLVAQWDRESELLVEELRRSRDPVREVQLPRRLTASQVVALAHDPDGLAASLARPMPARPAPQARRGSRFHRWVEELYGASPLIAPDDLPGAGDADISDDELQALRERFLADGWAERRPVAIEAPFELLVGHRLIRGRIDAVYPRDAGGFEVIDYKTGGVPADFAAASMQLSVYRLAWADLAGVDPDAVTAGFLYVRTGELKRPDRLLSKDELAALLG